MKKKITTFIILLFITSFVLGQFTVSPSLNSCFTDISTSGTAFALGDDDETNFMSPFNIYLNSREYIRSI